MADLKGFLKAAAEGDLLPWKAQVDAAEQFGLSLTEIEEASLEMELMPARYQRNRKMISTAQQLILLRSHVAVIGCGGLGGYVVEQLARLGVGRITAIDPDVFEEHNLNRQILSSPRLLGYSKAKAALERVREINPAVTLVPRAVAFGEANGEELVEGADVVVDAVDNVPTRMALSEVCGRLDIPLVHGAIAGWYGHVSTQFAGDKTLDVLYGRANKGPGVEKHLGNPSFTPGVAASFEVAEVCKILLGEGDLLRNRKLHLDLLAMEMEETPL